MMQEVTFAVTGMTCDHCKFVVAKTLEALDGVDTVMIDLPSRQVKVRFDGDKLAQSILRQAIMEAGYDVS